MPRAFQAPDPAAIRAQGADLYDELSIAALLAIPAEEMEKYRQIFAEGYLRGYSKGAVQTLEQLLPEAPNSPAELFPEGT